MVSVDDQVETHQVGKLSVSAESQHLSVVGGVIQLWVVVDVLSVVVDVSVDARSDDVDLGDDVHGIFVGGVPVLSLRHTSRVAGSEDGLSLES